MSSHCTTKGRSFFSAVPLPLTAFSNLIDLENVTPNRVLNGLYSGLRTGLDLDTEEVLNRYRTSYTQLKHSLNYDSFNSFKTV